MLKVEFQEGTLFHMLFTMNFLHFALLLFIVCTAVLIIVSLLTPAPQGEKAELISKITYKKSESKNRYISREEFYSYGVVLLVVLIWYIFS